MADVYRMEVTGQIPGHVLMRVSFGKPAGNDEIVRAIQEELPELLLRGMNPKLRKGDILWFDGPMSASAAAVITSHVVALECGVALRDLRLEQSGMAKQYVLVRSFTPNYEDLRVYPHPQNETAE